MGDIPRLIARLQAAGVPAEGILIAVCEMCEIEERRKAVSRASSAKHRNNKRISDVTVTSPSCHPPSPSLPDKERSPTPPKEINPSLPLTPSLSLFSNENNSPHFKNWPSNPIEKFWAVYPRKIAKVAATKALEKIRKSGTIEFSDLLEATKRYAADPQCEPEFIPHPATWLNQGRYLDDRLSSPVAPGLTEVLSDAPYFGPLCKRFHRENGNDPPVTPRGALLPTKWVKIASEGENERRTGIPQTIKDLREAPRPI